MTRTYLMGKVDLGRYKNGITIFRRNEVHMRSTLIRCRSKSSGPRLYGGALIGGALCLADSLAMAAQVGPSSLEERIARLESARTAINMGDNAWLLASAAL